MHQSLQLLLDIYTHIPVPNPPPLPTLPPLPSQHASIAHLLHKITTSNHHEPKFMFEQLAQYVSLLQEQCGPKQFASIFKQISLRIFTYVLDQLRQTQLNRVVVYLNYFTRICGRYFCRQNAIIAKGILAVGHFRKNTSRNMKQCIQKIQRWVDQQEKEGVAVWPYRFLLSLLQGEMLLSMGNCPRAKWAFSELISAVTNRLHLEQSRGQALSVPTRHCFVLATYFLAQTHQKLGNSQLSHYHVTQAHQFASIHIQQSQHLLNLFNPPHHFRPPKLTRIQNKIQRIKSLHGITRPLRTVSQLHKPSLKQKQNKKQKVQRELSTIMLKQQDNKLRLKKRTLGVMRIQNHQKQQKIQYFKEAIKEFQADRQRVIQLYRNEEEQSQMLRVTDHKESVQHTIYQSVWDVLPTLRPTHLLSKYFHAFSTIVSYHHHNKLFRAFCQDLSFNCRIKVFTYFMRVRCPLARKMSRFVTIRGTKHLLQLLIHKTQKTYHMRLYKIQAGKGVNTQMQIQEQTFQNLKKSPVQYFFQVQGNQLIPLPCFLRSLCKPMLCKIILFVCKLKRKARIRKLQISIQKEIIQLHHVASITALRYVLFITNTQIAPGRYQHKIQRVDCTKFANADYNIQLDTTTIDSKPFCSPQDLRLILDDLLLQNKEKHIQQLVKLQSLLKVKLAVRSLSIKKQQAQIFTLVIKRNLYTLVCGPSGNNFYIQHLDGQYPKAVLKDINATNLVFMNKLRQQLAFTSDCQLGLNVVQKYLKLSKIAHRFINKSKEIQLKTAFSTQFRKSLCFAKKMDRFMYRGKIITGQIMYVLKVKDFQVMPRPYLLRVFTVQSRGVMQIDIQKTVFNFDKAHLQKNIDKINTIVNVQDSKTATIIQQQEKPDFVMRVARANSKTSVLSQNSVMNVKDMFSKKQRHSRKSPVNKKNSINFKLRHRSTLQQKEVLTIKKWIEEICVEKQESGESSDSLSTD